MSQKCVGVSFTSVMRGPDWELAGRGWGCEMSWTKQHSHPMRNGPASHRTFQCATGQTFTGVQSLLMISCAQNLTLVCTEEHDSFLFSVSTYPSYSVHATPMQSRGKLDLAVLVTRRKTVTHDNAIGRVGATSPHCSRQTRTSYNSSGRVPSKSTREGNTDYLSFSSLSYFSFRPPLRKCGPVTYV